MSKHFKMVVYKAALLSMALSILGFTFAVPSGGDLDTTFSGDGRVTTKFGPRPGRADSVEALAIQSDDKIVAAGTSNGDFALARYNLDGSLDTTFNHSGKVLTNFGANEAITDVAVQEEDGKIVASGYKCIVAGECDVALARYNADGSLDTSFGDDGKVTTDIGRGDNGSGGIEIQSDGKILVAGDAPNRGGGMDSDFAVYRYNTDGSLDTMFGDAAMTPGIAVGNFGRGHYDSASDLVIQGDGKIVVAGSTSSDGRFSNSDFAIARLNSDGSADTAFGSMSLPGRQTTDFRGGDFALKLALAPTGKIVVVGYTEPRIGPRKVAIARYNAFGHLDTTFNVTGMKTFRIDTDLPSDARDVVVQLDGKIVVMGSSKTHFAMVRLNPRGAFDATFSVDGKVTVDFCFSRDFGYALVRQRDGKYVLGGTSDCLGTLDFALVRVRRY